MGEEEALPADAAAVDSTKKKGPPDGYVCRLCSIPGHWIQGKKKLAAVLCMICVLHLH